MLIDGGDARGGQAGRDPLGILDASHEAVAFLDRHHLPRTTTSYALALQTVLHPYGRLAGEVARRTDGGVRLTEDDVRELMPLVREHEVADLGLGRLQMEQDLNVQAETLEALTSDARAITNDFSHQVTALSNTHLGNDVGPDTRAIALLLEQLIARIAKTERDLEELAGNIAGLRIRMEPGDTDDRIDQLTGVTSRSGAQALADRLVAEPHGYVLAACSLDDLEGINERYGRSVADNVLRAFVATLRQTCEGTEIIRWQGNLFLVVLRGRPLSTLAGMMEDARTAMRERTLKLRGSGEPIGAVTMSGGVAVGVGVPLEDTLVRADMLRDLASGGLGNRIMSRA